MKELEFTLSGVLKSSRHFTYSSGLSQLQSRSHLSLCYFLKKYLKGSQFFNLYMNCFTVCTLADNFLLNWSMIFFNKKAAFSYQISFSTLFQFTQKYFMFWKCPKWTQISGIFVNFSQTHTANSDRHNLVHHFSAQKGDYFPDRLIHAQLKHGFGWSLSSFFSWEQAELYYNGL